jgi:hypothetical protein
MLPPLLDVESIRARLQVIFPDGTPERSKCTGLAAARTIYVMLYVGAIEGGEWLAPKYVYRMGHTQAALTGVAERAAYLTAVKKPGTPEPADRWYKENTRESIRDEALKNGLVPIGAVMVNPGVHHLQQRALCAARRSRGSVRPGPHARKVRRRRDGMACQTSHAERAGEGQSAAGRGDRSQGESAGDAAER